MINRIHSMLHRPEHGWDPIPPSYATEYSELQWKQGVSEPLLDQLDQWVGGLAGKRVLDLGGGPGHYSVAFAKRNAHVTWHDVSHAYQKVARQKADEANVRITFSIGYMEEAARMHTDPFDLVFNRICWYYGFSDRGFADTLFQLVRSGGAGYIDTSHSGTPAARASWSSSVRTWLNDTLAIKIGHPLPPRGRVAELFMKKPVAKMLIDYTSPSNDRVLFLKR